MGWVEVGGGGWSWMEVGARFNNAVLLQQFDIGNWWIGTRIDYHPCITSEPTNQVCLHLYLFFLLNLLTTNFLLL